MIGSERDSSRAARESQRPAEERSAAPQARRGGGRAALGLLAIAAGAWTAHVFGRIMPTFGLVGVWAVATALLAWGLFRRARIRRGAFLTAYFHSSSRWRHRLRGRWLMGLRQITLAAALAVVLLVALIRLDDGAAWLVLAASAPAVALLQQVLLRGIGRDVRTAFRPELAARLTFAVVGVCMVAALVALAYHEAYPDLADVSLERAVWHFVDQERARSAPFEVLLQLAAAKDAVRLWLAQQLMPIPGGSFPQALGWLILFAEQAVFVWSYLLLGSVLLIESSANDADDA